MMKEPHTLPLSFFMDFVIEDGIIYFPLANYNAICRGNLADDQIEIIDIFPNVKEDKRCAGTGIYKDKNYLLLYSNVGNCILVYDILQKKFSKLSDKDIVFFSGTVFEKNGYMYIVSVMTAEIYKADLQRNVLQSFVYSQFASDNVQMGSIIRNDDIIYISLCYGKVMLTFDLGKEKFESYEYPENIPGSYNLAYRNDELWIIGEDRKIYTWNIKEDKACIAAEFPDEIEQSGLETQYMFTFINKDILWIISSVSMGIIIKYNILTKQFEVLKLSGEERRAEELTGGYDIVRKIDDKVFILSSQEKILYEADLLTDNIQKHHFPLINMFQGRLYPIPEQGMLWEENYNDAFDVLLKSIMEYHENLAAGKSGSVGKAINEYINNSIS